MEQCPLCYTELEVRDCAPCDDCGWDPAELEHFRNNKHVYNLYEVYKGLQLTLCNFCDVDFGSYLPETFGFKDARRIGFENFKFIKTINDPQITKQKFCPDCKHTLKFLKFLGEIRALNK